MNYNIIEHKHRFASWAASRGASVINNRFSVEVGQNILSEWSLFKSMKEKPELNEIHHLPEPDSFDVNHRKWREEVILIGKKYDLNFTHGVAAKLLNIYLKSFFVSGRDPFHSKVKAVHPPIDSLLLDVLYKKNIGNKKDLWKEARKTRWSKLNSEQYEKLILGIKHITPSDQGLWMIEQYWVGYQ